MAKDLMSKTLKMKYRLYDPMNSVTKQTSSGKAYKSTIKAGKDQAKLYNRHLMCFQTGISIILSLSTTSRYIAYV